VICLILIVICQVVFGDSAIIGDAREIRGSIHGDHLSMVKFAAKSDAGYKKVLYAIEMLLEGLNGDQPGATDQSV
jgi:hypothetical protein